MTMVPPPPTSPRRCPPVLTPSSPASPSRKVRRKHVDDKLNEDTAIQRLVEYFVVVSSHPRWELNDPKSVATPRSDGMSSRKSALTSPPTLGRQTNAEGRLIPPSLGRHKSSADSRPMPPILRRHKSSAEARTMPPALLRHISNAEAWPLPSPRESGSNFSSPMSSTSSPGIDSASGNIHVPKHALEHTYQPKVTARYPLTDYADNPLNDMITQFCYPHSDSIVPSSSYQMPRIHHFVLTNEKGRKVYGTCLTFYEEYSPGGDDPFRRGVHVEAGDESNIECSVDKDMAALYLPRVLCILSTWPYLTAFREYLSQLYRLATTTDMMKAPIERYILNLCKEIPCPPPGAFEVQVSILSSTIKFWAPPAKLPIAYVSLPYETLFHCLDINSVLLVWYALFMEQKVLLRSSQYSLLTICSEILLSLLFPMQWSHLYVPLLPKFLSPMLDAPVPYLVGVVQDNWIYAEQHINPETIIVDLDNNRITIGPETPKLATPPHKRWIKLQSSLEQCAGEWFWKTRGLETEYALLATGKISRLAFDKLIDAKGNARWKERLGGYDDAFNMAYGPDSPNLQSEGSSEDNEPSQLDRVQDAFLRFYVSTLKNYRKFLHIPENGPDGSPESPEVNGRRWNSRRTFDRDGFIVWQKAESQNFYQEFCNTQQFDDFITRRLYSPGEPYVIFFDQSIDAKLNRSRMKVKKVDTPFLNSAKAHKVLKTINAVEPNEENLPDPCGNDGKNQRSFTYPTWPEKFRPSLFGEPRPTPGIIAAEFDRQAALVARLRANDIDDDVGKEDSFFGSDFEPSPEVATFTVFFFTYCSVIGLEWQQFQRIHLSTEITGKGRAVSSLLSEEEKKDDHSQAFCCAVDGGCAREEMVEVKKELGTLRSEVLGIVGEYSPVCPDHSRSNPARTSDPFLLWRPAGTTNNDSNGLNRSVSLLDCDVLAEYEEARAVASAQLDLAFDALTSMALRRLPTDADAFKSLMEACGRCGNRERAVQLIEIMQQNGFVADKEVYACFVQSFAQEHGTDDGDGLEGRPIVEGDAYAAFLKRKVKAVASGEFSEKLTASSGYDDEDDTVSAFSDYSANSDSELGNKGLMTDIYNAVFSPGPKKKKRNKKGSWRQRNKNSSKKVNLIVTSSVNKQVVLGENLLDYLYPNLNIDTSSETCLQCSNVLTEDEIVAGWSPCQFEDFTTCCPLCQHRFVPKFTVESSSPTFLGSQGKHTPLYCEFLSPWVLRKVLEHYVHGHGTDGIGGILDPRWRAGRDIRATIWWNLIVAFNRYRLPVSFLLQGSFQNRLISPSPVDW